MQLLSVQFLASNQIGEAMKNSKTKKDKEE